MGTPVSQSVSPFYSRLATLGDVDVLPQGGIGAEGEACSGTGGQVGEKEEELV